MSNQVVRFGTDPPLNFRAVDNGDGTFALATSTGATPASVPRGSAPGLAVSLPTANTDPGGVAIPSGATSVVLWFATSSTDPTPTSGRVSFTSSATALTGLTGADADTVMGHQAPSPYDYPLPTDVTYLHVASAMAGAVCRGMWLS